ncbi:MlaD family protein [Nocardioides caeni]|uniref:MCE family protein n=1 Tax=Nocardioides caeni TaxID=574700 RepID=A0A4S8N081_9ACTN|nr:MlaD family protein [Nocardioides caeni]THV09133.1 MCE family protein [Nocardioides caeni]
MAALRAGRLRRALAAAVAGGLAATASGCGLLEDGAYDLPLPGGADLGDDPRTVEMHFQSVEGLVPKSTVKVDNVAVGRIEDIEIDESTWTAVVTASVNDDVDLPTDVGARVRRSSLLGEWYVELVRPGDASSASASGRAGTTDVAAAAADTAEGSITIPLERTGGSARVDEVLGALSLLLNNGGLPQLNTIMTELNQAMEGNEPQLRALLSDLTEFTGQLDTHRDDVVKALDGLARLSRTLRSNNRQIARTLDAIPEGLEVLADQRPQLVGLLRSLDELSDVTVRVVNQSQEDMVADLHLLKPILRNLAQAGKDIPQALQIAATFPFTPAAMDATPGDYVNLDVKVDLDLGAVLGTLLASRQPLELGGQVVPNPLAILDPDPTTDAAPTAGEPAAGDSGTPAPTVVSDLLGLLLGGRS